MIFHQLSQTVIDPKIDLIVNFRFFIDIIQILQGLILENLKMIF
jgi:hypothetical protein